MVEVAAWPALLWSGVVEVLEAAPAGGFEVAPLVEELFTSVELDGGFDVVPVDWVPIVPVVLLGDVLVVLDWLPVVLLGEAVLCGAVF